MKYIGIISWSIVCRWFVSPLRCLTFSFTVAATFQVKVFVQPHYLQNFVQSTFNALSAEKVRGASVCYLCNDNFILYTCSACQFKTIIDVKLVDIGPGRKILKRSSDNYKLVSYRLCMSILSSHVGCKP